MSLKTISPVIYESGAPKLHIFVLKKITIKDSSVMGRGQHVAKEHGFFKRFESASFIVMFLRKNVCSIETP